MNKYRRLAGDTVIFAIGSLGSKLILFFLLPLYTNCLSASEYGTAELVNTFVELLMPVVSMVIFDAVLRFALDKSVDNGSVILNAAVVFAAGSLATVLLMPLLGLYESIAPWRGYVCLYVISYMARTIAMTYIKGKENSRLYVMLGLSNTLWVALLNVVLLLGFDLGLQGYLIAGLVGHVSVTVAALATGGILRDLKGARFDGPLLRRMMAYSAPLIINNLSWWVLHSVNKMMVEMYLDSAALGIYSVASKIPSLINVVITIFSNAWFISSVKEVDSDQDKSFFSRVFGLYSFGVFFFCACLLVILKPFMSVYVSAEFFEAWRYVPLLLVSACFSAVASYFGSLYSALNRNVSVMLSTLVSALVNIGVNLLLLPRLGVQGAAIGTAAAYFVIALYRLFDSRRHLKFPIRFGALALEVFAVLAAAVFTIAERGGWIVALAAALAIGAANLEQLRFLLSQCVALLKSLRRKKE